MKRVLVLAILIALVGPAAAHVGSPDVFFEGDAGPYRVFVTIRTPQVIPGIATIEIRSETPDAREVSVVPLRLTGPGSERPPTPDRADPSAVDPQFFTAGLWLMEHGSMQVRISVDGARGHGEVAVPVPAVAQRTLHMSRGLGSLLFGLMLVLALAFVAIARAAIREGALEPGSAPRARRRVASLAIAAGVTAVIALGNMWWNAEAASYDRMVMRAWTIAPQVAGCTISIPKIPGPLLPDHGHEMHLFLLRAPALDRLAHLHPTRSGDGYAGALPSLPAGHYRVYADVVFESGFPMTAVADLDLPELTCAAPSGDDSTWAGQDQAARAELADGARMLWDRPDTLRAGVALPLRFRVIARDGSPAPLEPYMGMLGHAEIVRNDGTVFAHIHPSGTVAMPALELAQAGLHGSMMMHGDHAMPMPPQDLSFPFGFPQPGDYRIFIQIKRGGTIETAVFDAHVES